MKTTARTVRRVDGRWLNKAIGQRVLALRKQRGLTAEQVGIGVGVTRAAVSNWELGNHGFPIETIYNIALFYGVSPRKLLP